MIKKDNLYGGRKKMKKRMTMMITLPHRRNDSTNPLANISTKKQNQQLTILVLGAEFGAVVTICKQ
jgi:hypothetical protein